MQFKVFLEPSCIHVVSAVVDVYEGRPRARLGDGLCGRDKSVRNCYDSISRLHPGGDQGKQQGRRSAPYANAILSSTIL